MSNKGARRSVSGKGELLEIVDRLGNQFGAAVGWDLFVVGEQCHVMRSVCEEPGDPTPDCENRSRKRAGTDGSEESPKRQIELVLAGPEPNSGDSNRR